MARPRITSLHRRSRLPFRAQPVHLNPRPKSEVGRGVGGLLERSRLLPSAGGDSWWWGQWIPQDLKGQILEGTGAEDLGGVPVTRGFLPPSRGSWVLQPQPLALRRAWTPHLGSGSHGRRPASESRGAGSSQAALPETLLRAFSPVLRMVPGVREQREGREAAGFH